MKENKAQLKPAEMKQLKCHKTFSIKVEAAAGL